MAAVVFISANKASADGILFGGKECKEFAIEADPSKTYTFIAQLPAASFVSIDWSAEGGIEIVSQSTTSVTIRSKSGVSYSDGYICFPRGQPNPANGTAKVSFQTSGDRRVAIVSRNGEVVSSYNVSDKVNSISLTDVTPGLYFVVATDGENKYCSKLTVK